MEGLLLVLFLLFSVATALLERRKRRQQLEEAKERQQQQRERGEMAPTALEEEEEVDEEWGGWPFPSGDPFEQPQAKPVARRVASTTRPRVRDGEGWGAVVDARLPPSARLSAWLGRVTVLEPRPKVATTWPWPSSMTSLPRSLIA